VIRPASSFLAQTLFASALLLGLNGCASAPEAGAKVRSKADPLEPWNRQVFALNEGLDKFALKPAANAYVQVVPQLMRQGVTNFFGNFADAWSSVNNFLQAKPERGFSDLMRVGTNTVFGIGGIFDVATEAGIDRTREDFGQTLGVWGLPAGPYIVWPVFGPSSLRDSIAMPLDMAVGPGFALKDDGFRLGVSLLQVVNLRANLLSASTLLDDVALDRYAFVRDAYLQRRRSLVYDGEPPDLPPEDEDGSSRE
jgi:phospholipid-binding lipoprotein MlaA